MTKLNALVFANVESLAPPEKFDADVRMRKIDETIQILSAIVPDLLERALDRNATAANFAVELTPDEFSDVDEYLWHNPVGSVMVDGDMIRSGKLS